MQGGVSAVAYIPGRLTDTKAGTDVSRGARTRARKLDGDQIHANLNDAKKLAALLHPDHLDVDKPGLGLFYCVECDRHFPSERDRTVHQKSKLHKREAKRRREEKPYTLEEANWASGVGVDNRQRNNSKPVEKIVEDDKEVELAV